MVRLSNFTMQVFTDAASYVTPGKEYDARLCMQNSELINEIKLYRKQKLYGKVIRSDDGSILFDQQ